MVSDTPEGIFGDVTPTGGVHFEVEVADPGLENWRLAGTSTDIETARCAAIDLAEQGSRSRVRKIRALRVTQQVEIREPPAARMSLLRKQIADEEQAKEELYEKIDELEGEAEEMERELDKLRAQLTAMEKASP